MVQECKQGTCAESNTGMTTALGKSILISHLREASSLQGGDTSAVQRALPAAPKGLALLPWLFGDL